LGKIWKIKTEGKLHLIPKSINFPPVITAIRIEEDYCENQSYVLGLP
jgi:hypothetical protein